MKRNPIPEAPSETLGQARTWDNAKAAYLRAGLCEVDAAQAAWGHQLGFTKVNDPCANCRPVVAGFPMPSSNDAWRRFRTPSEAATYAANWKDSQRTQIEAGVA